MSILSKTVNVVPLTMTCDPHGFVISELTRFQCSFQSPTLYEILVVFLIYYFSISSIFMAYWISYCHFGKVLGPWNVVMYVCMYIYAFMYVCVHVFMYVCICVCMYVYVCLYMYICMCVCMYIHYVCRYVRMYVYVCMYVCVCVFLCMYVCTALKRQASHWPNKLQHSCLLGCGAL